MHFDLITLVLCTLIGAFILLIYTATLNQERCRTARWPIMFSTFVGMAIASACVSSISLVAFVAIVLVAIGLTVVFFDGLSLTMLFISWALIMGAVIGRGLILSAIPCAIVLGCVIIFFMERRHYV